MMYTTQLRDPFTNEIILPAGRKWYTPSELATVYNTQYIVEVYVWYPGRNMGDYAYRADGFGNPVDSTLHYVGSK